MWMKLHDGRLVNLEHVERIEVASGPKPKPEDETILLAYIAGRGDGLHVFRGTRTACEKVLNKIASQLKPYDPIA
jgi:hypothetical protein